MNAEQKCDDGHDDQRCHAGSQGLGTQELYAKVDHDQQTREVEQVAPRQQQRLAADASRQLAECNQRAGEGYRADQHTDIDLHFMDRLFRAAEIGRCSRIDVTRIADQRRSQTNQAVHQRNQFRHLRHLHGARGIQSDAAAHQHGRDDPRNAGWRYMRPEYGCQHRDGHADHAVQIAAPRGFRIGQPSETQDEQDGRAKVSDRCKTFRHLSPLICGTSPACGE